MVRNLDEASVGFVLRRIVREGNLEGVRLGRLVRNLAPGARRLLQGRPEHLVVELRSLDRRPQVPLGILQVLGELGHVVNKLLNRLGGHLYYKGAPF